ncbi:MAG: hypothetical protein M3401_13335 [Actinomycetota bacterium]|nr:hypothetical protein [Actinomycetota bacterium]
MTFAVASNLDPPNLLTVERVATRQERRRRQCAVPVQRKRHFLCVLLSSEMLLLLGGDVVRVPVTYELEAKQNVVADPQREEAKTVSHFDTRPIPNAAGRLRTDVVMEEVGARSAVAWEGKFWPLLHKRLPSLSGRYVRVDQRLLEVGEPTLSVFEFDHAATIPAPRILRYVLLRISS